MGIKIQTIKDIRIYLFRELAGIYPEEEIRSLANIIIRHVMKVSKTHELYLSEIPVNSRQASGITKITGELKTGKPIQYILGETVFYDCRIKLNKSTLIPRPETEELVDLILRENAGYRGKIVDFGTGSGCIAIALASNLPGASVTATDISDEALKMAEANAGLNGVNITFMKDDILDLTDNKPGETGIIVSNPPYVLNSGKSVMNRNVLDFEPHPALFVSDSDPLVYYSGILRKAVGILKFPGRIYFEINESMGSRMIHLLETHGFIDVMIVNDINGKERFIKGSKNEGK